MTHTKLEPCIDENEFLIERVTIDNTPDIGDKTGAQFLKNLGEAVIKCQSLIAEGFRLSDFWTDPNTGVEFKLIKKKSPGNTCNNVK